MRKTVTITGVLTALAVLLFGLFSILPWNYATIIIVCISAGVVIVRWYYQKTPHAIEDDNRKRRDVSARSTKETILCDETIQVSTQVYYDNIHLTHDDQLKGRISSDYPVDYYFVDADNFHNWFEDKPFECIYSSELITESEISFTALKDGDYFFILKQSGRSPAQVTVHLFFQLAS